MILGLLCLLLSDLSSLRGLGPVGAIGIAGAMLSSLTLLPARAAAARPRGASGRSGRSSARSTRDAARGSGARSPGWSAAAPARVWAADLRGARRRWPAFVPTLNEDPVPQTDTVPDPGGLGEGPGRARRALPERRRRARPSVIVPKGDLRGRPRGGPLGTPGSPADGVELPARRAADRGHAAGARRWWTGTSWCWPPLDGTSDSRAGRPTTVRALRSDLDAVSPDIRGRREHRDPARHPRHHRAPTAPR